MPREGMVKIEVLVCGSCGREWVSSDAHPEQCECGASDWKDVDDTERRFDLVMTKLLKAKR